MPLAAQVLLAVTGNPQQQLKVCALFREGAELLASAIESVAGGATGSPQSGIGSYQSWPTRREVRALRARGGALLHVADLVRFKSFESKKI